MQPNNSTQWNNVTTIIPGKDNTDGLWGLRVTYYCIALALNLLTTGVAPKRLSTKPSFKIYIRHMCVIHILFILTQFIVKDVMLLRRDWVSHSTAQRMYTPLIVLLYYLLTFQVTTLSLDRWAAVELKLHYRHVSTARVSILGLGFMWLLAISATSGTLTPDLLSYRLLILSSVTLFCMSITVVTTVKLILSLRTQQSSVVPIQAAGLHRWRARILKEASSFANTTNDFDMEGLEAESRGDTGGRRSQRRGAVSSIIRSSSGIFTVDTATHDNVGAQHQQPLPDSVMAVDVSKKQEVVLSSKREIVGSQSCAWNTDLSKHSMRVGSQEVLSESDDSSNPETSSSINVISLVRDGRTNTFCRQESTQVSCDHKHQIVISCPVELTTKTGAHNQEIHTELEAFDCPNSPHNDDDSSRLKKVKSPVKTKSQLYPIPDLLSNSQTSTMSSEGQRQLFSPSNSTPVSPVEPMCDEGLDISPKATNDNPKSNCQPNTYKGSAPSQSTTDVLAKDTLQVFQIPRIATPTSDRIMCNIRQSSNSSLYPESRPFTPNFSERNSSASAAVSTTKKIYFATLLIAIWTCLTSLPVGLYFLHLCLSSNSIIEINPGDDDDDTKTDHFILLIGLYFSAIVNPLIYCWRLVIKTEWRQRIQDCIAWLFCCSS